MIFPITHRQRVFDAFFQSLATRHSGYMVDTLVLLNPGFLVIALLLMLVSSLPRTVVKIGLVNAVAKNTRRGQVMEKKEQ